MAEDLVQDTLMAIHIRRGTYDPALPFTAWVFGIARHKLVDEFRKDKRRASVPLDEAPALFAADDTEAAIVRRDVDKLLAQLPQAKRTLLKAIKLDGEAVADVARHAGMSEAAVKVSVHRSVKSLTDGLGGPDADR
jgi:RNA polymerase sigma-70 factor (ECF subfamily)